MAPESNESIYVIWLRELNSTPIMRHYRKSRLHRFLHSDDDDPSFWRAVGCGCVMLAIGYALALQGSGYLDFTAPFINLAALFK